MSATPWIYPYSHYLSLHFDLPSYLDHLVRLVMDEVREGHGGKEHGEHEQGHLRGARRGRAERGDGACRFRDFDELEFDRRRRRAGTGENSRLPRLLDDQQHLIANIARFADGTSEPGPIDAAGEDGDDPLLARFEKVIDLGGDHIIGLGMNERDPLIILEGGRSEEPTA